MDEVHYKTGKTNWGTPQNLFDQLDEIFEFDLDVCATGLNNKCPRYFTIEDDSLHHDNKWETRCWMNPPYGKEIKHWITKARITGREHPNNLVVCLVPARTDTKWWQDNIDSASVVVFLRGRLKFELPRIEICGNSIDENMLGEWVNAKEIQLDITHTETDDVIKEWEKSIIKIEPKTLYSAPFPSALIVFGNISLSQAIELTMLDLGWIVAQSVD